MTFSDEKLSGVIALLHDAALAPELWQNVIDALGAPFEDASCIYHHFDAQTQSVPASIRSGSSPDFWATYDQYYGAANPYPAGAFMRAVPGTIIHASSVIPAREAEKTEFMNDWMAPQGFGPTHLGTTVWQDSSMMALIAIVPPERVARRKIDEMVQRFERIIPEMQRTLDTNRTVLRWARNAEIMETALDAIPVPAFVIDRQKRLIQANGKAEALLNGPATPLRVDRSSHVVASNASAERRLEGHVKAAFALGDAAELSPVRVECPKSGRAFVVRLVPVEPRRDRSTIVDHLISEPALIMLLTPIASGMNVQPEQIRDALGLTLAEARIVSALVAGRTLAEYAEQAGLARNTVRNQLSSAFVKTGTDRQASLVATAVAALSPWWEA